ncbi:MAG: hypothetical protein WDO15_25340 [Bacteroidota bacterium]
MKDKNYKEALKNIELSKGWPENLGEGKPYDVDNTLQDYMTGYCVSKKKDPAVLAEINDRLSKLAPKH